MPPGAAVCAAGGATAVDVAAPAVLTARSSTRAPAGDLASAMGPHRVWERAGLGTASQAA